MPLWDNSTCNYQYKGCFYDCLSSISCDFYQSNVLIATNQKSLNDTIIYSIELDDCLNLCKLKGYSYAHMHFSGTIYRYLFLTFQVHKLIYFACSKFKMRMLKLVQYLFNENARR